MKKNFRNRLLAACAAASMSVLLLSGFDSALTVEDVNTKMNAAMAEMGGLDADVKGTADVAIDIAAGGESQSIPLTGAMDLKVRMTLDPMVMNVSGSMSGDASAMGMAGGMEMEMYMAEQEDGSGITYVRLPQDEDNAWHAAAVTAEDMTKYTDSIKASFSGDPAAAGAALGMDLSSIRQKLLENAELAPEAVNVNGTDCYEIRQTVDGDTFFSIVSEALKAMPEAGLDADTLSAFQMFFTGIRMDVVTDCRVDDFKPVYASIDLGGSDFTAIAQMAGAMMFSSEEDTETPEIGVSVNALNLAMNYGDAPDAIEIPAEALAAQVETTLSMDDAMEAAESLE